MRWIDRTIIVTTGRKVELIDITDDVLRIAKESDLKVADITLFSPHTTTALIINENEKGLVEDIEDAIKSFVYSQGAYRHDLIDDNAASHIAGSLLGSCLNLIFKEKDIFLGSWQRIFLVELDGPRSRKVMVRMSGE